MHELQKENAVCWLGYMGGIAEMSEWISIEDAGTPEIYNKPVLVTDGKIIDIASLRFIDGHLKAWDKNKLKNGVTHYMPLPELPK